MNPNQDRVTTDAIKIGFTRLGVVFNVGDDEEDVHG